MMVQQLVRLHLELSDLDGQAHVAHAEQNAEIARLVRLADSAWVRFVASGGAFPARMAKAICGSPVAAASSMFGSPLSAAGDHELLAVPIDVRQRPPVFGLHEVAHIAGLPEDVFAGVGALRPVPATNWPSM